jgi:hypothetical protein
MMMMMVPLLLALVLVLLRILLLNVREGFKPALQPSDFIERKQSKCAVMRICY